MQSSTQLGVPSGNIACFSRAMNDIHENEVQSPTILSRETASPASSASMLSTCFSTRSQCPLSNKKTYISLCPWYTALANSSQFETNMHLISKPTASCTGISAATSQGERFCAPGEHHSVWPGARSHRSVDGNHTSFY